jgi:membrane peptidoglycan carboxypeptidase
VRGSYPNTVNPLLGGGPTGGYQAGSTFKLFTALAAVSKGLTLNTAIFAPQRVKTAYLDAPSDPAACDGAHWCPSNAGPADTGVQTMYSGWGMSVNTYWVQLEERIGAANAVAMAEKLGLTWHNDVDRRLATQYPNAWGSFTLGVADTTPLEMASAYATIAAQGVYCKPLPVLSVTRPDGADLTRSGGGVGSGGSGTGGGGGSAPVTLPVAAPSCSQVVSPEVAQGVADIARCTTGYGAATGSCGGGPTAPYEYGLVGRPVAGKTGTTDNQRAVWFIGFTPQLCAASFIADPDNIFHFAGGWQYYKNIYAVGNTLRISLAGAPVAYFTPPPASIVGSPQYVAAPPGASAGATAGRAAAGAVPATKPGLGAKPAPRFTPKPATKPGKPRRHGRRN